MAVFFTSDPHFGHANIIKHCNRPFTSVEEMDQAIIDRWNARIGPNDTLYCLGDWCLVRGSQSIGEAAALYRQRIQAGRIILIWGNHDWNGRSDPLFQQQFDSTHDLLEIEIDGRRIVLCHYAMRVWNRSHYGSYHLYGHSHGSLPDDPHARSIDCGVDCHDFFPITLAEVDKIMSRKQWQPVDHHGADRKSMGYTNTRS